MKRFKILCLILLVFSAFTYSLAAQPLSGNQILKKVEDTMLAPKSTVADATMILIDKKGKQKVRKVKMWTKGKKKRVVKFLKPADVKGVGFLVLSDNEMYLYMPAFKKIRRIASHVKHQSFMGTDFSYDDISTTEYTKHYTGKLLKETDKKYIIEAKRKKSSDKEYDKLKMWVDKTSFLPTKVEMYKKNKLKKVMINNKIEKIGKYWMATDIVMTNVKKKHKTRLKMENLKFDKAVPGSIFTKRFLKRNVR